MMNNSNKSSVGKLIYLVKIKSLTQILCLVSVELDPVKIFVDSGVDTVTITD